tara:strand:+ start:3188 stop:6904 length:3717 start_codon:yes stop_codon:yes gene_type:complete
MAKFNITQKPGMIDTPVDTLVKNLASKHKLWTVDDTQELKDKDTAAINAPPAQPFMQEQPAAPEQLADIMAQPPTDLEERQLEMDPLQIESEERARVPTRVQQFGERFDTDITTLGGAYALANKNFVRTINENESPFAAVLQRAGKMAALAGAGGVGGTKITATQKKTFLETGDFKAAIAEDATKPLYKDNPNISVGNKNIFYDVLDAGTLNEKGTFVVNPELFGIMGVLTEEHFVDSMFTTDTTEEVADIMDADPQQQANQKEFKKAQGVQQLGRGIYQEWKRTQALQRGMPDTADYVNQIGNISPEVFTQIGDVAKTLYAEVNPDMIVEGNNAEGRVVFRPTELGAKTFENMYRVFSGLFNTKEVMPLAAASPDGKVVGEATQYTRDITTRLSKDLGDTSQHIEATKNMNEVAFVNNPRREKVATYLAMLALSNAGTVKQQPDMTEAYVPGPNGDTNYANIFKIGQQKYLDLMNEKASLKDTYDRLVNEGAPQYAIDIAEKTYKEYNPKTILRLEREKFVNLIEGVGRYTKKANYLTFALQALTGRMHAQQTLYNPQSHPIVRYVVGGGNKYQWTPGTNTKLEQIWMEGMSKHLFEDPKITDRENKPVVPSFKKQYGMGRPTAERIRIFKEQEKLAKENPGTGEWNQYAQWGNELKNAIQGFNTTEANQYLAGLKNSPDTGTINRIKKAIAQKYGSDPLSPRLKAYLAKFETEAIHQADYLMALADYVNARDTKTKFIDTQAWEIDGQTHGPATLATLLGSINMAKRSGIIMKTPFLEKLESSDYKDVRDAMADEMRRKLDSLGRAATNLSYDSKDGSSPNIQAYKEILELAIGDRENFLKKSPMTMGYGQEIFSLRQHVNKTIFLNDKIKDIKNRYKLSDKKVIDFLHAMLVDSIYETMDPQTLQMTKLMKSIAFASPLTNTLLQITQPTGLKSTISGLTSVKDGQTEYTLGVGERARIRKVQHYTSVTDPSAMKKVAGKDPEFGGYTVGRAQPAIIQAFDSNMVTKVFTKSWDSIKQTAKAFGATNPFVLQIFDAFLTDSGSLFETRKAANKHHKDSIINEQAIEKVFDWYDSSVKEKLNQLRNDDTVYELFVDNKVNTESEFKTIASLLAKNDRFKKGGLKSFTRMFQRSGEHKWERGDGKNITGDTLEEWNTKTFNASQESAVKLEKNIQKRLGTKPFKSKSYTGKEMLIFMEEILGALEIDTRIKEGRSLVKAGRESLRKEIGSEMTNNID